MKEVYLTQEGLEELKQRLDYLIVYLREDVAKKLQHARELGDLSENAEYDAAKEAQGMLEMRIAQMEALIANARILDKSKIDTNTVQILNKVTLKNHNTGKDVVYTLVSENEANLKEGKLSVNTPIAKALLGKKRGDKVDVTVPAGVITFEILDIAI